jgi:hypothetical protein
MNRDKDETGVSAELKLLQKSGGGHHPSQTEASF